MTLKNDLLDFPSIFQGASALRKTLSAISSINDSINDTAKAAVDATNLTVADIGCGNLSKNHASIISTLFIPSNIIYNSQEGTEVGFIHGSSSYFGIRLVMFTDIEKRSMGYIKVIPYSKLFNSIDIYCNWKRKYGSRLIDIEHTDNNCVYELTADDVGSTIVVQVQLKGEFDSSNGILYGEVGPITIDKETRKSISKTLEAGTIRFPVFILDNGLDISNIAKFYDSNDILNDIPNDILVISYDDVKVIKNGSGMPRYSNNKSIEWSAKYFGGNICIYLDYDSNNVFKISSGRDVHKQQVVLRATSKTARDMIALTMRCLNSFHKVVLESIIKGTIQYFNTDDNHGVDYANNIDYLDILAYSDRLLNELNISDEKREKYLIEKKLALKEKEILENEIFETIAAYQKLLVQNSNSNNICNNVKPIDKDLNDPVLIKSTNTETQEKSSSMYSNNTNRQRKIGKNGLINGFSGKIALTEKLSNTSRDNTTNEVSNMENQLIIQLQIENSKLKSEVSELNEAIKQEKSKIIEFSDLEDELVKKRNELQLSKGEVKILKETVESLEEQIKQKQLEIDNIKSNETKDIKYYLEKTQELHRQITELQSQNAKKQKAIQDLLADKSELSKNSTKLAKELEKLRKQYNQLNKRLNTITTERDSIIKENNKYITSENIQDPNVQLKINNLENKVAQKNIENQEMKKLVELLKSRIRKLALIDNTGHCN
ncbi:hypothetical protein ACR3K2_18450 [Cryptosporidium serpentis]